MGMQARMTDRWARCRTAGFALVLLLYTSLLGATDLLAVTEALPPLNYEQDGKVVGFSSELLDMMTKEEGINLEKQLLPWARAYDVEARQSHTLIFSLVRTPERESLFQWVGPISPRRIYLYKLRERSDIHLKSLDDAKAYRIGTTRVSAATKLLMKQGFGVNGPQDALGPGLDLGAHDEANMRKFVAKRFDLLVSLDWAAAFNGRNAGLAPEDLQAALLLDDTASYWYGLNLATDPDIARRLNAALQKIKADGRYQQLQHKYLPRTAR